MTSYTSIRRFLAILLFVTILHGWQVTGSLFAQAPVTPAAQPASSDDEVSMTFPNAPVADILSFYETLTGKILIRDANLSGPNLNIVVANRKIPKAEAIRLIEASLLLNGYSLVPDSENRVKVINSAAQGKNPRSEGVPLYANPASIPPGNQVVGYFMQLHFLAASDAVAIFQQHVVLHTAYGSIIAVPNAQAVVITENASLIREMINLQELIDVPPAKVVSEFVILKRADAERVAETINKLIEAQKSDKQKHTAAPAGGAAGGTGSAEGGLQENDLVTGTVQLIPDARTNRILVVTRPVNFAYIKSLIEEFDQEVGLSAPLERPLKYVSASEVLPVLADLLAENEVGGKQGPGEQNASAPIKTTTAATQPSSYNSGGGSSTNGSMDHPDVLSEPEGDTGPTSVIVGKTRLIADNKANSILVIGPPESREKVRSILDKLDKKPPQVYLSTVIGQFKLLNNNETGVDYLKLFQSAGSTSGNNNGVAASALNTMNALVTPQNLTAAAAFPATGGLSLYGTIGKNLSVYVHALESSNRFKVLARPVVYAANNKKAVISSGQRVAIPSSTLTNLNTGNNSSAAVASNIEYQDVVLKLEVIPLINANNEVNLKIAQVDDSISGSQTISGNTVPTISTQKIVTTVTVPDGGTVMLGGLITESTSNDSSGIPVLMHLPWVGQLFRDTKKNKERDELIIFIQPTVVKSDDDIAAATTSEKDRAETGDAAYQFAAPPAPVIHAKLDPFIPKNSKPAGGQNK